MNREYMQQAEILSALNLVPNQDTKPFTSKLALLFTFLSSLSIKKFIVSCLFREHDLTINDHGKVLPLHKIKIAFWDSLLFKYKYNDRIMLQLRDEVSSFNRELTYSREQLWKKIKNKNNEVLETSIACFEKQIAEAEEKMETLIAAKKLEIESKEYSLNEMREQLKYYEGKMVEVNTLHGSYSFPLPIGNTFYYAICDMLGLSYEVKGATEIQSLSTIVIDSSIFKNMDKALKFTGKDNLRPVMSCVLLELENGKGSLISTDAHRLYQSTEFECSQVERVQLLIPKLAAKELSKMKFTNELTEIHILADHQIMIEGKRIELLNGKFPDYKVVIPDYDTYMEFDKAEFVKNVKSAIPFANKYTSQVTFHLNGHIAIHAEDVDFEFQKDCEMPYEFKNFPDMDIAFNGIFLVEALDIFKEKNVKMYSAGMNRRAAIFTNGGDSLLLMPYVL